MGRKAGDKKKYLATIAHLVSFLPPPTNARVPSQWKPSTRDCVTSTV